MFPGDKTQRQHLVAFPITTAVSLLCRVLKRNAQSRLGAVLIVLRQVQTGVSVLPGGALFHNCSF